MHAPTEPDARAKRMTLSQIVELLLTRGQHDRSSVALSRNAKGETQIEVVVRTGEGVETVEHACVTAEVVYETLRARYPLASGFVGAQPAEGIAAEQAEIRRLSEERRRLRDGGDDAAR